MVLGKRGQSLGFFEIILVVALFFIVAVAWLVTSSIGSEINNYLLDDPDFLTDNTSNAVLTDLEDRQKGMFNGLFGLFVFGLFMIGGVSAWFGANNPVFFVVALLLVVIVLVVPAVLGDSWSELSTDFDGDSIAFMDFVMRNHLLFGVVFMFFVLGVMFARSRLDA